MKKQTLKQKNQEAKAAPATLDDIDTADENLRFIKAMVDMLFTVDGISGIDNLKRGTVSSMCYAACDKIKGLEKFMHSVYATRQLSQDR